MKTYGMYDKKNKSVFQWNKTFPQLENSLGFTQAFNIGLAETSARYMNKYVPFRDGYLSQNYETGWDSNGGFVKYTQPYANPQYYREDFIHSKEQHPLATAYWDKAMMIRDGDNQNDPPKMVHRSTEVLLSRSEYRDHELLKSYRPGGARGDNPFVNFYWDYYAQGKPCHAEVKYPALEEVLRVIHKNGGKAVLAHPGLYSWKRPEQLGRLLESGLDGVEAFSSYHTTAQAEEYRKKAEKWGLFSSGGSDFHGKIKPSVRLGEFGCQFMAREMEFYEILRK